ncbi:MAG: ABC transporter permease [Rhodobacteraceae bacterium]|nr:ABC transporter permease [Paracoccaceae bacterium]
MLKFVVMRFLSGGLSLAILVTLIFFFARLTGNPTDLYVPMDASEAVRAQIAEQRGFNDPVVVQFGNFLADLARGDLGQSLRYARPAIDVVADAMPTTLTLAGLAIPIATVLALVIGSLGALHPGGIFDRIAGGATLGAASLPDFWLAIIGILVFAVVLRWLPTSGTGTALHWVLPVAVLVFRPLGILAQVVRTSMLGVLSSDYIRAAEAKGLRWPAVLVGHALPNAVIPMIMVVVYQAAGILNGAVIVEVVFGMPGVGRLMLDSIMFRDFNLLQAVVIVTAIAIFIAAAVADLLLALIDPRLTHD